MNFVDDTVDMDGWFHSETLAVFEFHWGFFFFIFTTFYPIPGKSVLFLIFQSVLTWDNRYGLVDLKQSINHSWEICCFFSQSWDNRYGLLDLKQSTNQSWETWAAFPGKEEQPQVQRYPPCVSVVSTLFLYQGSLWILSEQRITPPYFSSISNCQEIFNVHDGWHTGPTAYRPPPMDQTFSPVSPARLESEVQRPAGGGGGQTCTDPNAMWIWSLNRRASYSCTNVVLHSCVWQWWYMQSCRQIWTIWLNSQSWH